LEASLKQNETVKLFTKLKVLAFERNLKKELGKIQREHHQFYVDEVETIGILYHLADEDTDKMITDFVVELRENDLKVTVLGLYKEKVIPNYYIQKLSSFLLTPKTINWFNKPKAPFVKSFIDEKFDLLIDLTMEDYQPLVYAGILSKAHFKTGRYTEKNAKYYDLMIHTEQVQTLAEFIEHVKHYLSKVNR